jgi:hypothetical protein
LGKGGGELARQVGVEHRSAATAERQHGSRGQQLVRELVGVPDGLQELDDPVVVGKIGTAHRSRRSATRSARLVVFGDHGGGRRAG